MVTSLDTTKLKRYVSYEGQVQQVIREKVLSGEYAVGEKIPSSREIAASLGTAFCTVQRALSALQKEGLLISSPRRGVFVQKREEKITCVGVYAHCGTASAKSSPYAHAVREVLREELHKDGIEMDLWMDSRPLDQYTQPWKPLINAAGNRQFQAFIATETNLDLVEWQQKLPVPVTFLGAPVSVPNNVDQDMRQFVEISLRELARQGCRSVGLIYPSLTTFNPDYPKAGDEEGIRSFDMLEHFTDVASELGLTVKNDWMKVVRHCSYDHIGLLAQERFGYEKFLEIWNQPEKPEGLLVFPDTTVRGVVMAIREKHIRVPEDLKLVLHKNESIDLFCPMPATFVVASEREMARTLIEQVQKQFRGESCERISLAYKLEAHTNP